MLKSIYTGQNRIRAKFPGFTLAELLICLAILGVVAMFTLPKILSAQQNTNRTAIFKETISALENGTYFKVQDGTLPLGSYACGTGVPINNQSFVKSFLNYTSYVVNSTVSSTYTLTNGATVYIHVGNRITYIVDWNGSDGSNTQGDDQFSFQFNACNGTSSGVPMGRFATQNTTNQTLYEQIFSQ